MTRKHHFYPGLKIHEWTVIQKVRDNPNSYPNQRHRWRVECSCGNRETLPEYYMTRVNPKKSCGCKNRSIRTEEKLTYTSWQMMRQRCNDPDHVSYAHYGGRGIKVCPEWDDLETGFELFLAHVGPRPSKLFSIDRIDNDKGYEPGNVRWATAQEQRANQRKPSI